MKRTDGAMRSTGLTLHTSVLDCGPPKERRQPTKR